MLGKRCVHFAQGVVFDNRQLRRRAEAHPCVRKYVETWIDSESIGFRQKSEVCWGFQFQDSAQAIDCGSRYNSRDSPWWMVQNIQDYCVMAPDGYSILSEPVKRRFPEDDTWVPWDDPKAYSYSSTIAEIIQEILQRHAEGISFREYNAGPNLDRQMKNEGFQIDVKVDWNTGFTLGGNEHNCGTWMDKMGESENAGTKGVPGTPRDGAPVEIIGLLFSTLRWLSEVRSKGKFPFEGVNAMGESLLDRCGFRRFSASEGLYTFGVSFQSTEYNGL
jgi:hypothetical protein